MDGYIIINSISATELVLDAWLLPSEIFGDNEYLFEFAVSVIEANTSFFYIDVSQVSRFNPRLPKILPTNTVFFSFPPAGYETLTKDFYLQEWEVVDLDLPSLAIPEVSRVPFRVQWTYVANFDDDLPFALPYDRQETDAGNGQTCKSSINGGGAFQPTLLRWLTDLSPPQYRYIIYEPVVWIHYAGAGNPDFSDYEFQSSETYNYVLVATTTPPEQPAYTGTEVWEISDEFDNQIEIDSGQYYYYLSLKNCWATVANSVLVGSPTPSKGGNPSFPAIIKALTGDKPPLKNVVKSLGGWLKFSTPPLVNFLVSGEPFEANGENFEVRP